MIRLHSSNRLETLVALLADRIETSPPGPFDREIIVVQSRGMERWLSMRLAERFGVWAGAEYPFPEKLVWDCFSAVLPDLPDTSVFERRVLHWRIMDLLPAFGGRREFAPVDGYLSDDARGLKRYQLSRVIAQCFDQYVIFRPGLVADWEAGRGEGWQPELWKALVETHPDGHRAAVRVRFFDRLRQGVVPRSVIPGGRLSVFGISALPPFYVEVFAALASCEGIDVDVYVLNPCAEYWSDIVPVRDALRIARRLKDPIDEKDLHFETGNRLLASMGVLGRDFLDHLYSLSPEETTSYVDPGRDTLLRAIQSDILSLRNAGDNGQDEPVRPDDRSLRVHSCHGPMREVEVLQDRLLDLFARDPTLTPEDVVVMTPEIETYSSLIEAVFSLPFDDPRFLPFTIADRTVRSGSRVIAAVGSLLSLGDSRFGVSEIMGFLECPALRGRFGIGREDIATIHDWVRDTGVRWGRDAEQRERLGFPPFSENSWRTGLDRMLLGYAMPGTGEEPFAGILPYGEIEGSGAGLLGGLAECIGRLGTIADALGTDRTLAEWSGELARILDAMFDAAGAGDEERADLALVREAANGIAEDARLGGFAGEVGADVFRIALDQSLGERTAHPLFLAGGLTFCKLLPMRSIPFRVVCLLGMNNADYPRSEHPPGFDLMLKQRRRGDRSRRRDDQYLFLEALLSAREHLHVSFVGQSIRDNSPIPPSVVVSELLEYVERGYRVEGGSIGEMLLVEHPLQPFSPRYFSGDLSLFSYSSDLCAAGEALRRGGSPGGGEDGGEKVFPADLPEAPEELRRVDLGVLQRFFADPARGLFRARLGVGLDEGPPAWDDREPFDVKGLDLYRLQEGLLAHVREERQLEDSVGLFRALGVLPWGEEGRIICTRAREEAALFDGKVREFLKGPEREPLDVGISLGPFRIAGTIGDLYGEYAVRARPAKIKHKDRLGTWIAHLLLNAGGREDTPRQSACVGTDGAKIYVPVKSPEDHLASILDLYWKGLQGPLPLFPKASFRYVEGLFRGEDRGNALDAAREVWEGTPWSAGEREGSSYGEVAFRGKDPIDSRFQAVAEALIVPLLEHERTL